MAPAVLHVSTPKIPHQADTFQTQQSALRVFIAADVKRHKTACRPDGPLRPSLFYFAVPTQLSPAVCDCRAVPIRPTLLQSLDVSDYSYFY